MGSAHATGNSHSHRPQYGALWSLMKLTTTPTLHKGSTEEVIPAVAGQKVGSSKAAAQVRKLTRISWH